MIFLWIKSKNMFFFNATNPGIEYGGFLMESKWKIYNSAPIGFFPTTKIIEPRESFDQVVLSVRDKFQFPFIVKPDVGSQGRGVTIISNLQQLHTYHTRCPVPYLIQEKVTHPLEAGIFYVRMPGSRQGTITGIVQKQFIKVVGDGEHSLMELLAQTPRYLLQLNALKKILGEEAMQAIVPAGEVRTLLEIGNHARGALFQNASDKISAQLTTMVNDLCRGFNGFYFGRLDIRFESWQALEKGRNFAVIELNGSGSEPTHMYDPGASLFTAWKEICWHWKIMQEIASHNHRRGIAYLGWSDGLRMFRENREVNKKLAHFQPSECDDDVPWSGTLSMA
jgi:hypothetical protein